jgi:hypothetical protein
MEQLGNLLTAMVAIIVSGSSEMMTKPAPVFSTHPELSGIDLAEFRRGGRYFGVYARVVKKLGVSRAVVTYTAQGRTSRRVLEALVEEIQRVDVEGAPVLTSPLNRAELSHFATGKYRGVFTRVAQSLQMQTANVWRVGHGSKSERVLRAIREEMARVDSGDFPRLDQLSSEEVAGLSHGGRYRGSYTRVAKQLGQDPDGVGARARHGRCSQRLLASIRAEMARVDAELAAKNAGGK